VQGACREYAVSRLLQYCSLGAAAIASPVDRFQIDVQEGVLRHSNTILVGRDAQLTPITSLFVQKSDDLPSLITVAHGDHPTELGVIGTPHRCLSFVGYWADEARLMLV
jgi:hypothetical protein